MRNVSSGEKKITLPDTSAVFESFLKVARTGEIDIPYDLNGIKDLLLFLKKGTALRPSTTSSEHYS